MNGFPERAATPPQLPALTQQNALYLLRNGGHFIDPRGYFQDPNVSSKYDLDDTGQFVLTLLPIEQTHARFEIMNHLGPTLSAATQGCITIPRALHVLEEGERPFAVLVTEHSEGKSLQDVHDGDENAIRRDIESIQRRVEAVIGRAPTRFLVNNPGTGKQFGTNAYRIIIDKDQPELDQTILLNPTAFTKHIKHHLKQLDKITSKGRRGI